MVTIVQELSTWDTLPASPDDWDALKADGCIGVVVKVSQGTAWVNSWAPRVMRDAVANGLLVGALHYAEPGRNPAELEAEYCLNNLPAVDLALGLWLELGDLGGKQPVEMGD